MSGTAAGAAHAARVMATSGAQRPMPASAGDNMAAAAEAPVATAQLLVRGPHLQSS